MDDGSPAPALLLGASPPVDAWLPALAPPLATDPPLVDGEPPPASRTPLEPAEPQAMTKAEANANGVVAELRSIG